MGSPCTLHPVRAVPLCLSLPLSPSPLSLSFYYIYYLYTLYIPLPKRAPRYSDTIYIPKQHSTLHEARAASAAARAALDSRWLRWLPCCALPAALCLFTHIIYVVVYREIM